MNLLCFLLKKALELEPRLEHSLRLSFSEETVKIVFYWNIEKSLVNLKKFENCMKDWYGKGESGD